MEAAHARPWHRNTSTKLYCNSTERPPNASPVPAPLQVCPIGNLTHDSELLVQGHLLSQHGLVVEEVGLHVAPHVGEPPELFHIGQQQIIPSVLSVGTCGSGTEYSAGWLATRPPPWPLAADGLVSHGPPRSRLSDMARGKHKLSLACSSLSEWLGCMIPSVGSWCLKSTVLSISSASHMPSLILFRGSKLSHMPSYH